MALDWSDLAAFAAVVRHGSISAAARATGQSQPTLSRRLAALEERFGQRLVLRSRAGITLTEPGARVLAHAEEMAVAADRLALGLGATASMAGTVRITASNMVAHHLLPPILAALHLEEPDIEIEVHPSDRIENLLRREADIAVRMARPTQGDVIARRLPDLSIGIYASHDYVARRGEPRALADLHAHDVVGYDRSPLLIEGLAAVGLTVDRGFFRFRSDDQVLCWRMVCAGYGIGFAPTVIGAAEPQVRRLARDLPTPDLPVWLTAHNELRRTPRIRRVFDYLAEALGAVARG